VIEQFGKYKRMAQPGFNWYVVRFHVAGDRVDDDGAGDMIAASNSLCIHARIAAYAVVSARYVPGTK
jgi:hypothetical protein